MPKAAGIMTRLIPPLRAWLWSAAGSEDVEGFVEEGLLYLVCFGLFLLIEKVLGQTLVCICVCVCVLCCS